VGERAGSTHGCRPLLASSHTLKTNLALYLAKKRKKEFAGGRKIRQQPPGRKPVLYLAEAGTGFFRNCAAIRQQREWPNGPGVSRAMPTLAGLRCFAARLHLPACEPAF